MNDLVAPLRIAAQKQWLDRECTRQFGIPSMLLMENASRAAMQAMLQHRPLKTGSQVLIFMGNGNNGGDGACLGRHLLDLGHDVLVCHTKALGTLPSPAREHVRIAKKAGVSFTQLKKLHWATLPVQWQNPEIIIDAICGLGLKGPLRSQEQELVNMLNLRPGKAYIVSLDVPTGLCQERGHPHPVAVKADLTVTFDAPLPALLFAESQEWTGKLVSCDIGIPKKLKDSLPYSWQLLAPSKGVLKPAPANMHKGSAGKILVIGGSLGMCGAPVLSALAALRAGCGIVHLLLPGGLTPPNILPEIQTTPVGQGLAFSADDLEHVLQIAHTLNPDALVIGPGMGRSASTTEFFMEFLNKRPQCPAVLDADALWHLGQMSSSQASMLQQVKPNDILTPHPGEMVYLLDKKFFEAELDIQNIQAQNPIQAVQGNRAKAIEYFCQQHSCCLVLKGAGTLIKHGDSPTVLAPFAVPPLAVGGSGDVLSGLIATLASSQLPPLKAASLGVYIHARAGQILGKDTHRGHLASEIAQQIPHAMRELYPD